MTKNPMITKTCSSCGIEKPLTAFLQVAGPEGTMYGTICAACRSGKNEKSAVLTEAEEGTKSSSGHKIDAKSKKKADDDKLKNKKEISEKYSDERDKVKEQTLLKSEKTEKNLKQERKHREGFLQSLGNVHAKEASKNAAASYGSKESAEAATKADVKAKGFDAHGPQIPSQTGPLLKTSGASFQAWLRTIGPSSAMARAFGLDKQMQKSSENKAAKEEKITKDSAVDHIENNFPSSRKGR